MRAYVCVRACVAPRIRQLILSLTLSFVLRRLFFFAAREGAEYQQQCNAPGAFHTQGRSPRVCIRSPALDDPLLCLDSNASQEGLGCGEQPVENNSCECQKWESWDSLTFCGPHTYVWMGAAFSPFVNIIRINCKSHFIYCFQPSHKYFREKTEERF